MDTIILFSGSVAGFIIGASFWFQAYKIYKTKEVEDISLWMIILLLFASSILFFYGIYFNQIPFIITNGIGVPALVFVLIQYFKLSKKYSAETPQEKHK